RLEKDDLKKLLKNTNNTLLNSLNNLKLAGFAEGSSDTLSLNIEAESPAGRFGFMGSTQLKKPYHFLGRLSGNNINLAPFIQAGIDTTALSFNAAIEGQNPSLTGGHFYFKGDVYNSLFGHIPIDSLRLKATLNNGLLAASYFYKQQKERVEGTVNADFNQELKTLTL